ncbi:MAG: STAS/SEC14 domain-containing protein [Cyanobacteria bacterium K_DeepCast_35m_m2_023]|nr:STAS/SEC14 domain-containing protein [Cyanobacteria bacterium K_DeepCast_35m_m2_023]
MIEPIEDLPAATLGFSLHGDIVARDIANVLEPAIEAAFDQHERIKTLLVCGDDFRGVSREALWDDTTLGLRHWDGFERMALVTDLPWLRQTLRAIALFMPCPVKLFQADQLDDARRWLSESLGTIHLTQQNGVVTLEMIGRLDPDVYARIDDDLANVFSHQDTIRLLLDLRQFEGWLGLRALGQHLALIREYRHRPQLVALIAPARWQQAAQRLLKRFVNARCRSFDSDQINDARQWLCTATPEPAIAPGDRVSAGRF